MRQPQFSVLAFSIFCALGAISLFPFSVVAQTTPSAPDEAKPSTASVDSIVVTARKREEPLQEVPVSATAFDETRLRNENITELKQLLQRTASVSAVDLGTSFSNEVVMRGIGAGRNNNAETATGLYRNGAFTVGGNIGGRTFNRMDFFDIQRVEILRGPQGALFGRNAVGGAINIINKRPGAKFGGEVALTYGINETAGLEATLNLPVNEVIAFRLGGKYNEQKDGWFTNVSTGEILDKEKFQGGRVSVAFTPNSTFQYNLMFDSFKEDGPSFGVYGFNPQNTANRFNKNFNTPSRFNRKENTVIGEGNLELGIGTLTFLTYKKKRLADTVDDFDQFNNVTAAAFSRWQRFSSDDFKRFGQEIRLANSNAGNWQWLIGAEYLTLKDGFDANIFGVLPPSANSNSRAATFSDDKSNSYFGLLGYDFSKQWNITGEYRATKDEKKFQLTSLTFTSTGVGTTLSQNYAQSFRNNAKVVALTYKPSKAVTLFVRYADAFRPGGFNSDPDRNVPARFSIPYDAETSKTSEFGIKSEWWERRLRMNVTAFQSTISNILINSSVASVGRTITYLENSGRAKLNGIELDMNYVAPIDLLNGRITIDAGLSNTDGSFIEGKFSGKQLTRARPKQYSGAITYDFKLFGKNLYVNYNYQEARGAFQDGQNLVPMDLITTHNAGFGLRDKNLTLSLNFENIGSRLYAADYVGVTRTVAYSNKPGGWQLTARYRY